jgi:cyclopropane fatty-acyl-phospholipid synthase-like methyltransferase
VVLEWGPGGGSNLHALAPHATVLYGVDISQQNLQETERVLRMQHPQVDFHAILLRENPAEVLERVLQPVDIFVSTAVFQHFPSQQYGADVLNVVGRLCAKGCVGLIQIRFDNGNPKYTSKDFAEYERLHITATSYELSAFWDLCRAAGLRPVSIFDINTTNNYAYVAFTKG